MIDKEQAKEYLQQRLADNLIIVDSYESPDAWCFGLAVINDKDELIPLMGDNIIKISKETGELE